MPAKKRRKPKRLRRKISVFLGKRDKERKAWEDLKNSKSFKDWQLEELPRRAAIVFFDPEKKQTPGEVAQVYLKELKKKKKKSGLDLAKIHYLKQVLRNTQSINHFEAWVKQRKSYDAKFTQLLAEQGGADLAAETSRKEMLEREIPQALKRFRASPEGAGLSSFSRILEGYLGSIKHLTQGSDRPMDDYWAAQKKLIMEALAKPETKKKLKKNFDELLK